MNIEKLINKITNETIIKLKKTKLLKDNKKITTFNKTENILKNYNNYLKAIEIDKNGTIETQKLIHKINEALKTIENDEYYSIIEMIYFQGKSREYVAEFYDVEVKTITRNKHRLINKLKVILFSDESILEIYDIWQQVIYFEHKNA